MSSNVEPMRPATANWMLLLLVLANVLSVGDRMLLSVVTEPVRLELQLSDPQMALVNGLLFVTFHLLGGLLVARLVDRGNRVRLLAIGIAAWSVATAATSLAEDFSGLAMTRIAVGLGEAIAFPVAMSLIPDLFELRLRGRATASFQCSGFIGVMACTSLAGWLAGAYGWRSMFVFFGVLGLALAAVVYCFGREPPRSEAHAGSPGLPYHADLGAALRRVFAVPGFSLLTIAFGMAGMVGAVVGAWGPAMLQRSHGMSLAQVGVAMGLASGAGGILGSLLAGVVVDRLARQGAPPSRMLLVPIILLPLSAPLLLGFALLPSFGAAIACAGVLSFLLGCAVAPCVIYSISCVAPGDRGLAAFAMLAAAGLLGSSLGPLAAAGISDALGGRLGSGSLRYAMACIVVAPLAAAMLLEMARRASDRSDMSRKILRPALQRPAA